MATPKGITEAEFQRMVTDLATVLGWQWAHFRPAQTQRGWRTAVSGQLGKGFPDLVLAHERYGVLFAELKRDGAKTTPEQDSVGVSLMRAGARYRVWRPQDLEGIAQELTRA